MGTRIFTMESVEVQEPGKEEVKVHHYAVDKQGERVKSYASRPRCGKCMESAELEVQWASHMIIRDSLHYMDATQMLCPAHFNKFYACYLAETLASFRDQVKEAGVDPLDVVKYLAREYGLTIVAREATDNKGGETGKMQSQWDEEDKRGDHK